ncbi:ATP-binding cassette domain-containing protein [Agaribacter marinus]|uniref:ABC transporter ATP-binding protein n=1 Tax=Virgibacillus salarius TaxID=447199 RepID=A0A941DXG9_9BACI|nr:ABC transporter ATP-binding protein [Virgibacillus salarius]MBR7795248.1 ABC transporter ATP-binding protein [Virgibacillus salarius]NAZ07964.1 ATP-binding cassette domain-containing protein [Agaribacter marinus]
MKIEVRKVTKRYHLDEALKNVSFTLKGPKIYGLLGRNGAGKSTFMDILAGNILATSGEVLIDGENPFDNQTLSSLVCLIKEGNNFKRELKIKEVIRIYAFFYPEWDQQLAEQLLHEYNLKPQAKIKTLSKGMESALGIIVGLASKAPITIFDEPYIGLDAAARKNFYKQMLEEFENEKRMIIFSTHLIDEVSLMFEEVLILQEGRLVLQESAEVLREQTCAVTGKVEDVEAFIKGKEVIEKKQLAGMMTAYLFGSMQEAEEQGLKVEGIPTQELMIHLTEKKRGA